MATSEPRHRSRSRSRSPRRKHASKSSSGFRWKEKKPRNSEVDDREREDRTLERGYRQRREDDDRRDRRRDEDREEEEDEERRRRKQQRREERRARESDNAQPSQAPNTEPAQGQDAADDDDIARKFGPSASTSTPTPSSTIPKDPQKEKDKSKPKPKSTKQVIPSGPMIVVKVNDRLGTTSKIPCLASDKIGDFKKLVAMQIGRKPHEIMLKRQSERPFKDFLTLEDYGVSDGVQLDLEIDTGD